MLNLFKTIHIGIINLSQASKKGGNFETLISNKGKDYIYLLEKRVLHFTSINSLPCY